jgi:hypothetical protein
MPINSNNAFVAEGGYQYDFFAIPARIGKEMRQRRAKGASEGRLSRMLPKGPRPSIRPQLHLPQTAKK